MKNNETIICTLPIKPQECTNAGMLISPIIMDFMGTVLDCEKNLGINLLHSYEDKSRYIINYYEAIEKTCINFDSIFIDKNHCDKLLEYIKILVDEGFVEKRKVEKYVCKCGMIDMIKNSDTVSPKLYLINNDDIICNNCLHKAEVIMSNVLVYKINDSINKVNVIPNYLKTEFEQFNKKFKNTDYLITKQRDTGYSLIIDNEKYNIDIDFLWMNYFNLFKEPNQIYIASNHQLFQMYLMNNLIQNTTNKNVTFIANPYLKMDVKEVINLMDKKELEEFKKLLILYNLKWKNKDCAWDKGIYEFLINSSDKKLINLYQAMILSSKENFDKFNINDIISEALLYESNMQKNLTRMKKLIKENKLKE